MITEGLVSPSKSHEIIKSKDIVSPKDKVKIKKSKNNNVKPTTFKLDQKHDVPGSRVKKTDQDMAKFLLEKAKQAQKLAQQKRERTSVKTPQQRREFVLPTQSSRSSRTIIPNKRFLEDDSVHSVVKKKAKPKQMKPEKDVKSPIPETKKVDQMQNNTDKQQIGLLEQPLIVDGKRERKLSLKMKQKSADFGLWQRYEDFKEVKAASPPKPVKTVTSPLSSPLAAPKLGSSLFSQSGTQFQKASGMVGLGISRKPGSSIVQKAKLQLNIDALNKSKAALARSLKAKMKKEAKIEGLPHQEKQQGKVEERLPSSPPPLAGRYKFERTFSETDKCLERVLSNLEVYSIVFMGVALQVESWLLFGDKLLVTSPF